MHSSSFLPKTVAKLKKSRLVTPKFSTGQVLSCKIEIQHCSWKKLLIQEKTWTPVWMSSPSLLFGHSKSWMFENHVRGDWSPSELSYLSHPPCLAFPYPHMLDFRVKTNNPHQSLNVNNEVKQPVSAPSCTDDYVRALTLLRSPSGKRDIIGKCSSLAFPGRFGSGISILHLIM